MANKALNIELGDDQQAILRRQLESGRYEDASEVVNDALLLLGERDAEFDDWLREDVQASLADKTPPSPMDEVFKRLHARIDSTAKSSKRGA